MKNVGIGKRTKHTSTHFTIDKSASKMTTTRSRSKQGHFTNKRVVKRFSNGNAYLGIVGIIVRQSAAGPVYKVNYDHEMFGEMDTNEIKSSVISSPPQAPITSAPQAAAETAAAKKAAAETAAAKKAAIGLEWDAMVKVEPIITSGPQAAAMVMVEPTTAGAPQPAKKFKCPKCNTLNRNKAQWKTVFCGNTDCRQKFKVPLEK